MVDCAIVTVVIAGVYLKTLRESVHSGRVTQDLLESVHLLGLLCWACYSTRYASLSDG